MKHFTLLFPRLSKAFNCCKNDWITCKIVKRFGPQWGFHLVSPYEKQRPRGLSMVKLLSFSLIFVSCKKYSFSDMTL